MDVRRTHKKICVTRYENFLILKLASPSDFAGRVRFREICCGIRGQPSRSGGAASGCDRFRNRLRRNNQRRCSVHVQSLARRVLYHFVGGGDLQETPGGSIAGDFWASRIAWGLVEGTSPVTRQRTIPCDRLAWLYRSKKHEQHAAPRSKCRFPGAPADVPPGGACRTRSTPAKRGKLRSIQGFFGHRSIRGISQHWGMSRLTSRCFTAGVHLLQRCSALRTPESSAHTAPPLGRDPAAVPFCGETRSPCGIAPVSRRCESDGTTVALQV
jgi:hypothetical protein